MAGEVYGSDFCTGGTATASNYYSTYTPAKAFDDSTADGWYDTNPNGWPKWLKYDLGVGVTKTARKLTITVRAEKTQCPGNFQLQGSNNDSSWTTVHSETSSGSWETTQRSYTFTNSTAYRYYQLVIENNGGDDLYLIEVEMMELLYSSSTSPSLSPSISPSVSLSISPSISPSNSPSASLSPSISPSLSPSISPSISPSLSPSISPSTSPSASLSPSISPSPSASSSYSPSPSEETLKPKGRIIKELNLHNNIKTLKIKPRIIKTTPRARIK